MSLETRLRAYIKEIENEGGWTRESQLLKSVRLRLEEILRKAEQDRHTRPASRRFHEVWHGGKGRD